MWRHAQQPWNASTIFKFKFAKLVAKWTIDDQMCGGWKTDHMWSGGCQPEAKDAWSSTNIKTELGLQHDFLGYYFISFDKEFGLSCESESVLRDLSGMGWRNSAHISWNICTIFNLNIWDKQCGLSTGFEKNTWKFS